MTEEKIINIDKRPAIEFIRDKLGKGLIGAEIGVNKGYNAAFICATIEPKLLYLIDPWNNFLDPDSGEIIGEAQYLMTKEMVANFPYKIIRATSFEAVKEFTNESLDFVYIDANHSYLAVLSDITRWYPIVKKGGILSGHDFTNETTGIRKAVEFFCKQNKKDFYTQEQDWWLCK